MRMPTLAPKINRNKRISSIEFINCGPSPPIKYELSPMMTTVRLDILVVKTLVRKVKGIMVIAGIVKIILIVVTLASGKACAITPKAGEIAAPAITVAIEIEMIVGFNILPLM